MSAPEKIALSPEPELAHYHALSAAAMTGLVLGLLSPLALVGPALWFVPCLAGGFSLLGLWRISRREGLIGRGPALVGLMLSASFLGAGPALWYGHRWLVVREARCYADGWFDFLSHGRPEKAYLLTLPPRWRPPLDRDVWEYYRTGPRWSEGLEKYVAPAEEGESPNLVRTLLALGPHATARYYEYAGEYQQQGKQVVNLIYAVTFEQPAGRAEPRANAPATGAAEAADASAPQSSPPRAGSRRTFFVLLELMRHEKPGERTNWQLLHATGGVRPAAYRLP